MAGGAWRGLHKPINQSLACGGDQPWLAMQPAVASVSANLNLAENSQYL